MKTPVSSGASADAVNMGTSGTALTAGVPGHRAGVEGVTARAQNGWDGTFSKETFLMNTC